MIRQFDRGWRSAGTWQHISMHIVLYCDVKTKLIFFLHRLLFSFLYIHLPSLPSRFPNPFLPLPTREGVPSKTNRRSRMVPASRRGRSAEPISACRTQRRRRSRRRPEWPAGTAPEEAPSSATCRGTPGTSHPETRDSTSVTYTNTAGFGTNVSLEWTPIALSYISYAPKTECSLRVTHISCIHVTGSKAALPTPAGWLTFYPEPHVVRSSSQWGVSGAWLVSLCNWIRRRWSRWCITGPRRPDNVQPTDPAAAISSSLDCQQAGHLMSVTFRLTGDCHCMSMWGLSLSALLGTVTVSPVL